MVTFPEAPKDGETILDQVNDSLVVIWTYSELSNEWTCQITSGQIDGYVTTRQVLTVGNTLLDQDKLAKVDPFDDPAPHRLETQEAVNNFMAGASTKILARGQRTQLNLDFLQNTLDGGYWVHKDREQEVELPGPATFFALTKDGENAENFDDVDQFIFNSSGIDSAAQLDYACQGTTLFLADISDGGYGLYVITGVEQIGSPEGGQYICTFDVVVQRGKAGGPIPFNAHCEMKVMSPSPCLVQGEEPIVDDWGYLWYNPATKELSVSEWSAGETPGSSDVTWTKYSPGGGPDANPDDYLRLSGGTMTGALQVTRPGVTTPSAYLFSVQADGLEEGKQVAFRVTAEGKVKAGHDTGHAFMASAPNDIVTKGFADNNYLKLNSANDASMGFRLKNDDKTLISLSTPGVIKLYHVAEPQEGHHAATRNYVDNAVAAGGANGGGSFQTKYDGNRLCKGADVLISTTVERGEVAFYGDSSLGTTAPQNVRYIGLNVEEFNWDSFIGSGIIRVRNGANDAGFYQVYHRTENASRNIMLHVKPVWSDVNQVLEGSTGTPCYFQGVFFE